MKPSFWIAARNLAMAEATARDCGWIRDRNNMKTVAWIDHEGHVVRFIEKADSLRGLRDMKIYRGYGFPQHDDVRDIRAFVALHYAEMVELPKKVTG